MAAAGFAGVAAVGFAGAAAAGFAGAPGVAADGVAGAGGGGALSPGDRVRPPLGSSGAAGSSAPSDAAGGGGGGGADSGAGESGGLLDRRRPRGAAPSSIRAARTGVKPAGSGSSAFFVDAVAAGAAGAGSGDASTSSPAASRAAFSRISAIQASASSIPCVFAFSIGGSSGASSGSGAGATGAAGGGATYGSGGAGAAATGGRALGASRVASGSSFGARASATASPSHARCAARAVRCSTNRSVMRTGRGGLGDESLVFRSSTSQLWSGAGIAIRSASVEEATPVAVLEIEDHVERPMDVIGETGRLREQLLGRRPHHSPNRPSSTSVMSTSNSCAQAGQLTTPTASPSLLMRS